MLFFTEYAPAERATPAAVERDRRLFEGLPHLPPFLDAVPTMCVVLNRQRQVVFANRALFAALNLPEDEVYGKRAGELFDCEHAFINPAGCGTSKFCRTCGAVNAILSSLDGQNAVNECQISQRSGDALDLRTSASRFDWDGQRYSIFAIEDIGAEKRRRALERIFFHDVLNTAGTLMGYTAALQEGLIPPTEQYTEVIYRQSRRLVAEIEAQRDLASAEENELVVRPEPFDSLDLLREVCTTAQFMRQGDDRHVAVAPEAQVVAMASDTRLLGRVLINMVKNALEACQRGEMVTLNCRVDDGQITFSVHNPAVIPPSVQLNIFKRSFSTKGSGRGLGTYSMKLLTERYLGGSVWFESGEETGTTFYARYPVALETWNA